MLNAGKRYLWVAAYNSGNPRFVLYSENLSSTGGNTPAGDFSGISVPENMSVEYSEPLLLEQSAPEGGEFQSIARP